MKVFITSRGEVYIKKRGKLYWVSGPRKIEVTK